MPTRSSIMLVLCAVLAAGAVQSSHAQAPAPVPGPAAKPAGPVDLSARFAEVRSDPKQSEALFKVGRKVAAVCFNCHGEGGNSVKPDVPNLAGQNPAYLFQQIRNFSEGKRRNEFMEGILRALNTDEKIGMVLFYSAQTVQRTPAANPALVAKGKDYFSKTCFRCHGTDGRGNEKLARIAGQQPEYMRMTLKRYRTGTGPRIDPLMADTTRNMSDADIDAVVAYVNSME